MLAQKVNMITIPEHIINKMVAHAQSELPNEACGLLTGVDGEVLAHYPLTNADASPEHFSFDPREQFSVLKESRAAGQKILANYHSHPKSPARPSEEDIRLAADPNIIYVIVSLAGKKADVKAYARQVSQNRMRPCEILITQNK